MQDHPVILLVCIHLLWLGCSDKRTASVDNKGLSKVEIDSFSKVVLQKFSINGDEYKNDSNCLSFYCCRNYDTTTLIQIKKHEQTLSGIYYQILPTYHRFITDYADRNTRLLFFEGYSFTIDSTEWPSIVNQAKLVLQEEINMNVPKVTDATTYGLLYNHQIQQGRSGAGDVIFDRFDRFLKDSFLDKFIQARKPISYKKTK
jgi:hypothetical protein